MGTNDTPDSEGGYGRRGEELLGGTVGSREYAVFRDRFLTCIASTIGMIQHEGHARWSNLMSIHTMNYIAFIRIIHLTGDARRSIAGIDIYVIVIRSFAIIDIIVGSNVNFRRGHDQIHETTLLPGRFFVDRMGDKVRVDVRTVTRGRVVVLNVTQSHITSIETDAGIRSRGVHAGYVPALPRHVEHAYPRVVESPVVCIGIRGSGGMAVSRMMMMVATVIPAAVELTV
jgi:hypothetical protein